MVQGRGREKEKVSVHKSSYKMVQANHHSKSKHLASDRPFENGTILNQNVKMFEIGMAFGFRAPTVLDIKLIEQKN